ncbi:MAG: DUF1127 domain-containing protein [Methylobacterium mesophilicum]|nr:DUF1127 domain-containing protein [Methylobacterium mesophilicum]
MATLASLSSAPSSRFAAPRAANAVARLVEGAHAIWKAMRNRREIYRLGEMTDAELADIGLTRTDLYVAVSGPLSADPTTTLGTIAHSRIHLIEEGARRVA